MSYHDMDTWHGNTRAESMDTKGGILFNGTSVDSNHVNQIVINFNINMKDLDVEELKKLKEVLNEIRDGIPLLREAEK